MSSKKKTIKNLSIAACMILLIAGTLLLSAALMQTESPFCLENQTLLSGALPGLYVIGKFSNRRLSKSEEGCIMELGKIIVFIIFFPFSLIFLLVFGKKK